MVDAEAEDMRVNERRNGGDREVADVQ